MKCTSCDSELAPGATICDACGAPVEGTVQPAALPEPPSPDVASVPEEPVAPPYQPFEPLPASSTPPAAEPFRSSYAVAPSGEKILGLPADQMGNIALGLGGAGCLFSVIGCGGLISILGLIAGFLSLKTSGRRFGTIGLVLSGLGLIVTLVMMCIIIYFFMQGNSGYNNGY